MCVIHPHHCHTHTLTTHSPHTHPSPPSVVLFANSSFEIAMLKLTSWRAITEAIEMPHDCNSRIFLLLVPQRILNLCIVLPFLRGASLSLPQSIYLKKALKHGQNKETFFFLYLRKLRSRDKIKKLFPFSLSLINCRLIFEKPKVNSRFKAKLTSRYCIVGRNSWRLLLEFDVNWKKMDRQERPCRMWGYVLAYNRLSSCHVLFYLRVRKPHAKINHRTRGVVVMPQDGSTR